MSIQSVKTLASICHLLSQGSWMQADIDLMSVSSALVSGGEYNGDLIGADLAANDALWRILSLIDPFKIDVEPQYRFVEYLSSLREILMSNYSIPSDEAIDIAKPIAGFVSDMVLRAEGRGRRPIGGALRAQLVELQERVYCWYCGAQFSHEAVESFIAQNQRTLDPFRYVDFVTQRGAISRDLQIEVDHIEPVASGGSTDIENLRISCGWCNRHKRELKSLYDAGAMPFKYDHPRSGMWLLPPPYWVIRVVGTRRRCESTLGCVVKIENEQLFVAPRNLSGAIAPGNMGVYCREHDPLSADRWIPNV